MNSEQSQKILKKLLSEEQRLRRLSGPSLAEVMQHRTFPEADSDHPFLDEWGLPVGENVEITTEVVHDSVNVTVHNADGLSSEQMSRMVQDYLNRSGMYGQY